MKQTTGSISATFSSCFAALTSNGKSAYCTVDSGLSASGMKVAMSLLPDAETFKRLVDGSARGPGAALTRLSLAAIAGPYSWAMLLRNTAYDRKWLPISAAPVPVISVGNLTLGGTGKTPLVAWVARTLGRRGHRITIVSRGYGAKPGERSDESAELSLLLPSVPHVADRDRVAGARYAAAAGAEVVVLDDGFQHRRLRRDLDIVAIDATDPFGCGHVFPRGLLREPLAGLARAQAVVLTRAGLVSAARRTDIRLFFEKACGSRMPGVWVEAEHRPLRLCTVSGKSQPLEELRGKRVMAFAGIGNPAAFRVSLEKLGGQLVGFYPLTDHHIYSTADLTAIATAAHDARADIVVTTLKDLVKVQLEHLGSIPLMALEIALELLTGAEEMDALLATIASASVSPRTHVVDR